MNSQCQRIHKIHVSEWVLRKKKNTETPQTHYKSIYLLFTSTYKMLSPNKGTDCTV